MADHITERRQERDRGVDRLEVGEVFLLRLPDFN
jgi:hypothetical protein